MNNIIFIVVNSQEFGCNKDNIMDISPVVKNYFNKNPKSECFVCNIESFKGNESNFQNFLNGGKINITYDTIPFVKSLSKVFQLKCFNDQISFLEKSYESIFENPNTHFKLFENYSNLVFTESYDLISHEITPNNFEFFARSFLSFLFVNPSKIKECIIFLKSIEAEKNILIFQEFKKYLKMKHFIFRLLENFLSTFHSKLFLKPFFSEINLMLMNDQKENKENENIRICENEDENIQNKSFENPKEEKSYNHNKNETNTNNKIDKDEFIDQECDNEDIDFISFLYEEEKDKKINLIENCKNEKNSSLNLANCLFSILKHDDVDALQIYISNPEFDINSRFYDVSLIEYSAFLSSTKCFKFLLNNHIQVDKSQIGLYAIAGRNAEIVHICEQKGAFFENALKISVAFQNHDFFNWLIETKNQTKVENEIIENCFLYSNFTTLNQLLNEQKIPLNDLLLLSAQFSQISLFEWISNLPGIDIDHKNSKGQTSLHFACLNDDVKLAEYILTCNLSKFVDVNSRTIDDDITPLHISCQNNNFDIVKLLLSNPNIDVNSQTFYTNRMSPLHYACKHGNYKIVDLLLKNNSIRINALTYNHKTPFYYACKNGFIDIVKLLILNKADTDTLNTKNSTTPILIAGIHDHFDIVKLLISSKNVNEETKLGETLLLMSSKSGNVEMTQILLKYGANIHSKNKNGLNALHYACKGKDCKVMIIFLISNGIDLKEETKNIFIIFFFLL